MGSSPWLRVAAAALLPPLLAGALAAAPRFVPPPVAPRFADAENAPLVAQGRRVFAQRCANCHGRSLQGQPLWQLSARDGLPRAPALDSTGPSWQRGDDELFRIIQTGHPARPANPDDAEDAEDAAPPPLPAAAPPMVTDPQALAALAYIKAGWPLGQRIMQAGLNPSLAGLSKTASADWRFDPTCFANGTQAAALASPAQSPPARR